MRPKGDAGSRDGYRKPGDAQQREEDSSNQIRVTNISEDTTENDLRELFRRFGTTSRIYLAKDKGTNQSRGFAFITYTSRADAQKAIDRLNGYGYGNLILHVEFAKPREEDSVKTQGAGNRAGWTMAGTK
jgi:translation initiation factor 3 subunit G